MNRLKCLTVMGALITSAMLAASPASAQRLTDEEREQAYYNCRQEFVARGMGDDDAANAYCYNYYYNEQPYSPPPKPPCSSPYDNCTRPD